MYVGIPQPIPMSNLCSLLMLGSISVTGAAEDVLLSPIQVAALKCKDWSHPGLLIQLLGQFLKPLFRLSRR